MASQKFTFSGSVLLSHEATKTEQIEQMIRYGIRSVLLSHEATKTEQIEQMIRYGINGLAFVEEIQVEVKPPERV